MLVGLARFDLRIPACGSLKEKRHVVKGLTAGIRQKFNVSVAEVGSARPRLRTAVGHEIRIKVTPELEFEEDAAAEHGGRIEEIIARLHADTDGPTAEGG